MSGADNLSDKVASLSLYVATQYRSFTIIAEYLGAANTFNVIDLNFNGTGAKPVAFNVELDYAFKLIAKEMTLALSWQKTKQALTLGFAEKRFLIGLSLTIFNDTLLSFEYTHEEDYSINHGGSDEGTDNVTIQLVVEF